MTIFFKFKSVKFSDTNISNSAKKAKHYKVVVLKLAYFYRAQPLT